MFGFGCLFQRACSGIKDESPGAHGCRTFSILRFQSVVAIVFLRDCRAYCVSRSLAHGRANFAAKCLVHRFQTLADESFPVVKTLFRVLICFDCQQDLRKNYSTKTFWDGTRTKREPIDLWPGSKQKGQIQDLFLSLPGYGIFSKTFSLVSQKINHGS